MKSQNLTTYPRSQEQLDLFLSHYRLVYTYIPPGNNNPPKKKPKKERICRFCNLFFPQTTFNSRPHIISKCVGRNSGYSDFECDKCNNLFSVYETQLSEYIGLERTINSLEHVNPKQFTSSALTTVKLNQGQKGIAIKTLGGSSQLFKNLSSQITELQFEKTYNPLMVYKALIKIALSTLPSQYVPEYVLCLKFLQSKQYDESFAPLGNIHVVKADFFVKQPFARIFQKKDINSDLPSHIFQLYYNCTVLQLHIPFNLNDKNPYDLIKFNCIYCPPLVEEECRFSDACSSSILDLKFDGVTKEVGNIYFEWQEDIKTITPQVNTDLKIEIHLEKPDK